jgi:hypothetical protein
MIRLLFVSTAWMLFALPGATMAFAFRPAITSRRRWSTSARTTIADSATGHRLEQDSSVCRGAARDDDDDDAKAVVVPSTFRRNLLLQFLLVAGTAATTLLPRRAAWAAPSTIMSADEDGKALRLVRSSQKKLASEAVAAMVAENDYLALQQLFRTPPFSNIRKACTTLAKDDMVLKSRYQMFISALERLDATALGAIRGRNWRIGIRRPLLPCKTLRQRLRRPLSHHQRQLHCHCRSRFRPLLPKPFRVC